MVHYNCILPTQIMCKNMESKPSLVLFVGNATSHTLFWAILFLGSFEDKFIASIHLKERVSLLNAFFEGYMTDLILSSLWSIAKCRSQLLRRHDILLSKNGTKFFCVKFYLYDRNINSFAFDLIRIDWFEIIRFFPFNNISHQLEFYIEKVFLHFGEKIIICNYFPFNPIFKILQILILKISDNSIFMYPSLAK